MKGIGGAAGSEDSRYERLRRKLLRASPLRRRGRARRQPTRAPSSGRDVRSDRPARQASCEATRRFWCRPRIALAVTLRALSVSAACRSVAARGGASVIPVVHLRSGFPRAAKKANQLARGAKIQSPRRRKVLDASPPRGRSVDAVPSLGPKRHQERILVPSCHWPSVPSWRSPSVPASRPVGAACLHQRIAGTLRLNSRAETVRSGLAL